MEATIAIIGVGVALAGLMLVQGRSIRRDIGELRQEMHSEIGGLRQEMRGELGGLRQEMRGELGGLR